ncbi:acyl-CoA-like ligand-binding transcription factor [Streptomyces sp. YKOK-I1]
MSLILRVPTLQADSAVRHASWRALVTEFAARRLDRPVSDLLLRIGSTVPAASVTAHEPWLRDEDADLSGLLDLGLRPLAAGYENLAPGGWCVPGSLTPGPAAWRRRRVRR